MAELKKCPFCGGEAMLVPLSSCSGEIACGDCHFESATYWNDMREGGTEKWQDKAVKAWNSRASEDEIQIKAISEILEIVNRAYHNFGGYDLAFMQKYGNTTAAQQYESYSTMMMYEIANEFDNLIDEIAEKLKEK